MGVQQVVSRKQKYQLSLHSHTSDTSTKICQILLHNEQELLFFLTIQQYYRLNFICKVHSKETRPREYIGRGQTIVKVKKKKSCHYVRFNDVFPQILVSFQLRFGSLLRLVLWQKLVHSSLSTILLTSISMTIKFRNLELRKIY